MSARESALRNRLSRVPSVAFVRILPALLLSIGLLAAANSAALGQSARVAVTVDDLPHTGGDQALGEARRVTAAMTAVLDRRGLKVAPFTVEHADYIFNSLYVAARAEGDSAAMGRLGDAYLNHLDRAFAFAEDLATETFGRGIPHVFLIHANAINAEYLEPMLDRLEGRGYRFVSLAEAVEDPAYDSRNGYTGSAGVSWLHRWREGLGLDDRLLREPDPPDWILQAYRLHTASASAGP